MTIPFTLPPCEWGNPWEYQSNATACCELLEKGTPEESSSVRFIRQDDNQFTEKGSYPHKPDYNVPVEEVGEDELMVGPYNLSYQVFTSLCHHGRACQGDELVRKVLGKVIKKRRNKLGLTQNDLSESISRDPRQVTVSKRTISRVENGQVLPHRTTLLTLCKFLQMSFFFCLQRTSRLYWETYEGEAFPSIKEEYSDVEI